MACRREKVEAVTDFIFLGSKVTGDIDWSHEIKRCLLLGRKPMTNRDSTLKGEDVTLPTKAHLVRAMVFPVVMNGCKSWTIKKGESRRNDAFQLRCWRGLLRVSWPASRSNQSILKGLQTLNFIVRIDIEAEAETPILWPPDAKSQFIGKDWCWERLKGKGEGGGRDWDG